MDELHARVGHLLIVGGRAVSIAPPGALAEMTPKRAQRVREGDSFFILITPADGTRAPSSYFEELAHLGADTFFASSGGVTGALRESLGAINRRAVQGGAVNGIVLVQRGSEVFAARSGHIFGALYQDAALTCFPLEYRDPIALNLATLGLGEEPAIQFARYTVAPGQMMLLADANLAALDESVLTAALQTNDLRAALDKIKENAGPEAAASMLHFAGPDVARDPTPVIPRTVSKPRIPPSIPTSTEPLVSTTVVEEVPAPGPEEENSAPVPMVPKSSRPLSRPPISPPAEPLDEWAKAALERVSDAASKVAQSSREHAPGAITTASVTARRSVRDALRAILNGMLNVTRFFQKMLDKILPKPGADGKSGIPTNIAAGVAIVIPITIVLVVLGLVLSKQGQSQFERDLEHAQKAYNEARQLSGDSCTDKTLRPAWVDVLALANQARRYRPNDPEAQRIRADAMNYLDCFDHVWRRELTRLYDFPDDAELVGPILHANSVDLYTLDRHNGVLYHHTLNDVGDRLVSETDTPLQSGQAVGSYVIGDMFDIEFLRSGGTPYNNVLIALDRSGLLISYSQTFYDSAQQLVTENRWVSPVAMAGFEVNLYVLDPGADQIWKYVPTPGDNRYSNAPEEYFTGAERPHLEGAIDFGISSSEGSVYILFQDGHVERYRRNAQGGVDTQPFAYNNLPDGALTSGRALFVDNDSESQSLYVVDDINQTIYESSFAGKINYGYRPRNDPNAFRHVSGLYADSVRRNNMYVVAGNSLYHFNRNEQ
jgi:hypothetical protein